MDIDPEREERQGDEVVLARLRTWSPRQRSAVQARLTAMVRASSRRAWRARHPGLSPLAADVAWAEAQYGPEVGAALRRWMEVRA